MPPRPLHPGPRPPPQPPGKKDKVTDKNKWGMKIKLDAKKSIIELGATTHEAQLLVMTSDGVLKSYALTTSGLTPTYALMGAWLCVCVGGGGCMCALGCIVWDGGHACMHGAGRRQIEGRAARSMEPTSPPPSAPARCSRPTGCQGGGHARAARVL